jgi:cytochrome c5
MLRGFILISLLLTIAGVAVLGFRGKKSADPPFELFPDMVRQMKVRAQSPSGFFADGRGSRMPIEGTVPIGYEPPRARSIATPAAGVPAAQPREHLAFSEGTDYYDTGKMSTDHWGTGMPMQITPELMQRGRERFNMTCAMCHGATAAGNGIVKQHGLATVVSLQDDRIRGMSDGEIFNTITNGKNTMMPYGSILTVADRWAIISYLRALQRSQNATIADVPQTERAALDKK